MKAKPSSENRDNKLGPSVHLKHIVLQVVGNNPSFTDNIIGSLMTEVARAILEKTIVEMAHLQFFFNIKRRSGKNKNKCLSKFLYVSRDEGKRPYS